MHKDSAESTALVTRQPPSNVPLSSDWGEAFADDGSGDSGMMLKRAVAAVLRYRWLVLAVSIVAVAAALFVKRQFAAIYEAEGKLWISGNGQAQAGPVRAGALLPSNSWGDLLSSYAVLGQTTHELHLFVHSLTPANDRLFANVDAREVVRSGRYTLRVDSTGERYSLVRNGLADTIVERGLVGDSIGRQIGLRWVPAPDQLRKARMVAFTLVSPREAALALRTQIRTELPPEGNLMRIFVTGPDGWRAERTVNSLMRHLVATADTFKRRDLTEVTRALNTQLTYAGNALQQADDALESFRMQTITLPSEAGTPINGGVAVARNPVISNFFNIKLSHETVAHERDALQQTLRDIQAGRLDVQALWQVLPADANTQDIAALLQEYTRRESQLRSDSIAFTDDYPAVQDARAALAQLRERTIPAAVGTLIEQLRRREDDLGRQISEESTSLREIPVRTVEEVRLTRNVEARSQLYSMLRSRYEEAQLAELSVSPDLAILDSATTPEWPITNRGRQVFAIIALAGLAGAFGLAVLLDQLDKRLRYIQQVPRRLRLPIIGAVPHAPKRRKPGAADAAQLVESFRSLRLSVTYAAARDRQLMLTVTSAGAEEGKSLVSANLALSFAEGGYRTVLVDGDVRRGSLHATFGTTRRLGLADVLRGSVMVTECLRPTSHPNLELLPSGSRLANTPELLTSDAFRQLIERLQMDHDIILIDSPPLAAGMDPHALCVATGNVLFVTRLAQTNGDFARQKLDVLERLPVTVLGTVVNDVRSSVGLNSEYSYLPGYAVHDEDDTVASVGVQPLP